MNEASFLLFAMMLIITLSVIQTRHIGAEMVYDYGIGISQDVAP
jgi:hypothetical protein